ncbi:MAG: hypothetical protein AAFO07_03880 [Bacteroidota bacterium]
MTRFSFVALILLIFFLFSCDGGGFEEQDDNTSNNELTTDTAIESKDSSVTKLLDCALLDGTKDLFIVNSKQYSFYLQEKEGGQYIIIIDKVSCSLDSISLEVKNDQFFRLFEESFNENTQSLVLATDESIYSFAPKEKELKKLMEPTYYEKRFSLDAQSGSILELKFWNNYLWGYATDFGVFAFEYDAEEKEFKPFIPVGEYTVREGEYNSLFNIKSLSGEMTCVVPLKSNSKTSINFQTFNQIEIPEVSESMVNAIGSYCVIGSEEAYYGVIDLKNVNYVDVPISILKSDINQIKEYLNGL